ncbi:unnamed protein product [Urochloa humidicola]
MECIGRVVDDAFVDEIGVVGAKTQAERARAAMRVMDDDDRRGAASRFVEGLRLGDVVSRRCQVYNGTGDTLRLAKGHDWHGKALRYPNEIRNGQWDCFSHVSNEPNGSSTGAVVYRGNDDKDFLLAWSTPAVKVQQYRYFDATVILITTGKAAVDKARDGFPSKHHPLPPFPHIAGELLRPPAPNHPTEPQIHSQRP